LPFEEWYAGIRDKETRARIRARILQLVRGLFGDNRHLGGVAELKLDFGPGYRIYYVKQGDTLVILLAGGDKSSQSKDIERARALWEGYKNDPERFRRDFPE
jgi:putative addiction module killer protein